MLIELLNVKQQNSLLKAMLEALMELLNLDQAFDNLGTETSVYYRMRESKLIEKFTDFKQHPNQDIYDAASDLMEIYKQFDAAFGDID